MKGLNDLETRLASYFVGREGRRATLVGQTGEAGVHRKDFTDLCDEIEMHLLDQPRCSRDPVWDRAVIALILDAVRLLSIALPPEAAAATQAAESYLAGTLSASQLLKVRVGLWPVLDRQSGDFDGPEANALRLAHCATFDMFDHVHLHELLHGLRDFALAAGANDDALRAALIDRFSDIIGREPA